MIFYYDYAMHTRTYDQTGLLCRVFYYYISFHFISFRYSSIVNNNINIIIIKSMLTDDGEIYNVDIYIPYRRANDGEYSIYRRLRRLVFVL